MGPPLHAGRDARADRRWTARRRALPRLPQVEGRGDLRGSRLIARHVERFNRGVRTGDFREMAASFAEDAEVVFEGIPVGAFRGRAEIAAAYLAQPPDDEIVLLDGDGTYAWAREPPLLGRTDHVLLVREVLERARLDHAARHRVHADPTRRQLHRQVADERLQRRLRGPDEDVVLEHPRRAEA